MVEKSMIGSPPVGITVTSHEPSNCGADDAPGVALDCVLVRVIRVAIATMTRAVEIVLLFMILSPFWLRSHYLPSNPASCADIHFGGFIAAIKIGDIRPQIGSSREKSVRRLAGEVKFLGECYNPSTSRLGSLG
jgi:hypothetical protein